MFPSLTGRLKTVTKQPFDSRFGLFQSLTGRLKTLGANAVSELTFARFNPSQVG